MNEDEPRTDDPARLLRLATTAAVSVAVVLVLVKLVAWLITGSVAMMSTMVDSLLDAMASLLNLIAVRHALQPADREHRFGHGKAEALAGLGQSAFIAGSSVFLVLAAGQRLLEPAPLRQGATGIAVMVFSIVLTAALVQFQRYVIRRTASPAIRADSLHYVGDILVNLAVILAFLLASGFGWVLADPLFAIGIAGYILWTAWGIARRALDILMDHELPDADRERMRQIALSHPDVEDLHDLRTRSSGQQTFIQFHLELAPTLSLARAHEIADAVEAEIRAAFPGAEVLIHQDPAGLREDHAVPG